MKFGLSDIVLEDLRSVFSRHPDIRQVLVFGSRAKGNYREGSDIDLAVIGDGIDFDKMLRLRCEIDDLGLFYKVDLLDYRSKAGTPIAEHIDRVGQVLYQSPGLTRSNSF